MLTQEEKLSKFMLAINEYAQEQHDKIMREVDAQNAIELEKAERNSGRNPIRPFSAEQAKCAA